VYAVAPPTVEFLESFDLVVTDLSFPYACKFAPRPPELSPACLPIWYRCDDRTCCCQRSRVYSPACTPTNTTRPCLHFCQHSAGSDTRFAVAPDLHQPSKIQNTQCVPTARAVVAICVYLLQSA
jgi:hypothetical protein